ncbi:hypothetical protein ST201phi2-1p427 [Pseudomonas phage 201phi2-1]|uniref:Uncharacterized protein n=1 Tax=Pseudomonas phage 201phi2-1 TaxID=198110 RepID=B3FJT5_BP201|nr:hypothetical protein ST201phi2-1p427 [Pseudomonas phage 201phi2-1]ABY63250.1 hypothetical protein 201phi2-1p427 [Pseudomonas phage 201phi2-1]
MKRLDQYEGSNRSGMFKYRIEADGELEQAIQAACDEMSVSTGEPHGMDDRPKHYPYIAFIHPDDEYYRVDLGFATAEDLVGDGPGSLDELKDMLYNYTTMKPWLDRIHEAAQLNGEASIEFRDLDDEPNFGNQYAMNNKQADWLRSQGWVVHWEKYPRTWIVSGW